MAIKVIVELQAKPGKRDELKGLLESIIATHGADEPGFLGSMRFEVVGDPDALVEMADWESVEARASHMERAASIGVYAPLGDLLALPVRALVVQELP